MSLQMEVSDSSPLVQASSPLFDQVMSKKRPHHQRTPLLYLDRLFRTFPLQVFMVIVTIVDLAFLLFEYISGNTTYDEVTLTTSLLFFLEISIFVGYEWREFFVFDRYWVVAEIFIVTLSFVVEYAEYIMSKNLPPSDFRANVRYLRAVRILRVPIIWKTRLKHLKKALRQFVSADRRRFKAHGYDLDLTYVYSNLIAMSWPSDNLEALYRNHIDNVAKFLDTAHPQAYRVYNLCAERAYDESKFHNLCKRYRLDDHNPAELPIMLDFAHDVYDFLTQNPLANVAVVHCKGGKGRTGTMCAAYLILSGLNDTAESALSHFGELRTSDDAKLFQGVESPSQERYVRYFERLMKMPGHVPPPRLVRCTSLRIRFLPWKYWDIGKLWFSIILKPNSDRQLHYVSNPTVTFDPVPNYAAANFVARASSRMSGSSTKNQYQEGCQSFSGNMIVYVNGSETPMDPDSFVAQYVKGPHEIKRDMDVVVEINTSGIRPFGGDTQFKFFFNENDPDPIHAIMQFWVNPSFEGNGLSMTKSMIDGPHKDMASHREWSKKIALELEFATVQHQEAARSS